MEDIKDLTLEELRQVLLNWKQRDFYARQIFSWIYKKGVKDFSQMSDLPADLRQRLKENFYIFGLKLVDVLKSKDRTQKFLFALKDKNLIEAVIIPAQKRVTGCISTQVGCKFGCKFCASGLFGFRRNLTCAEMLEEVLYLKNNSSDNKLTHLVFMGIGEPLDNYDNVIKAMRIINSDYSFNIGARRITISTCGIIPALKKLADEDLQIELSISLHAADDKTRSLLMPINKKYPLKDLIFACQEYIKKTNRQITFEYVLIKGINSDLQAAQKLSIILRNLRLCKVNLIPSNMIKELKVEPPNKLEILFFRNYLLKAGINVTLRRPRGQDIEAACGQLRFHYEKR
jgi:23S rRNA (adenine2503-C2)-methyltransferase